MSAPDSDSARPDSDDVILDAVKDEMFRTDTQYRESLNLPHDKYNAPWKEHGWIEHSQILLNSYLRWTGRDLIPRTGSHSDQAKNLFEAPFVVVSHGTQADPILNYGNQTALELWQIDIPTLLQTPSRLTAEPVHRDERARLLERTTRDGYVDDYQGIRISTSGRRFRIHQALVWNLVDEQGRNVGQAATFSEWEWL